MGFVSLQHIRNRRFTSRGPKPARCVPPSGFGYPRDGLHPSSPCPPCFMRAALLGFTLRSFLLTEGWLNVSVQTNPLTVWPHGMPAAEAASPPAGRRFLGFDPSESSSRPTVWLARRPPDAPLGFALPGLVDGDLFPDFAGNPPPRFVIPNGKPVRIDRRPGVSISRRSTFSSGNGDRCRGQDGPPRVPAPVRSRAFVLDDFRAIGFTFRRVGHYCRPSGDLWKPSRITGIARDRLWRRANATLTSQGQVSTAREKIKRFPLFTTGRRRVARSAPAVDFERSKSSGGHGRRKFFRSRRFSMKKGEDGEGSKEQRIGRSGERRAEMRPLPREIRHGPRPAGRPFRLRCDRTRGAGVGGTSRFED